MEGRLTKEAASVPRGTQIRISIGNFQYLATAANAFDHAVKRLVLAIDWIIWIIRQVLPRALDRPALGGGRPVPPAAIACPGSSMEVVRIDFAKELTGSHRHDVVTAFAGSLVANVAHSRKIPSELRTGQGCGRMQRG
jgi:hypothetical protein